jgi:death on curing protein
MEAAALWESLSQNHPFVDGNKRTAFAAMLTLLAVNGVTLAADEDATIAFALPLYRRGAFRFEKLEAWLRKNAEAS